MDEEGSAQDVAMGGPSLARNELRGKRDTLGAYAGDQGIELSLRESGDRRGHRDLRVTNAVEVGRSGRQGLDGGGGLMHRSLPARPSWKLRP